MKERGIIFAGPMELTEKIYRYVSLSQFMAFVEKQQVTLSKVTSWEDTWEAPTRRIPVEHEDGSIEYPKYCIEEDWYGQCWSRNGESDALWRIYSPNKEGILIQTTVEKFKLIKQIQFGMVAPVIYYDNLPEILRQPTGFHHYRFFTSGFLKRDAFSHEQEVRLITVNDERAIGTRFKNVTHIELHLDPFEFIEGIVIDPRASEWYVSTIQEYCRRVGFSIMPEKSKLYSEDIFGATNIVRRYLPVKSSDNKPDK